MPERIERAAEVSVGRGVGFAALAIGTAMAGLSFDLVLALKSGATLAMLTSAILALKALAAPRTRYKRTETWILLEPRPALPPERAQMIVAAARRRVLGRYARLSLATALFFWVGGFALQHLS